MKAILLFIFSISLFAYDNSYEFENFKVVDDFSFNSTLNEEDWSILVFNRGYCPVNRTQNRCFPYETKLEYFSPNILAHLDSIQILNMDTERTNTWRRYDIRRSPTVLFLYKGREMKRLDQYQNSNDLIQQTLDTLFRISN